MSKLRRMSKSAAPANDTLFGDTDEELGKTEQKTLVDVEEEQPDPVTELKQYFNENLPFLTDHERIEIMEKYLNRDLRNLNSIEKPEANQFLSEKGREGFRDNLLDQLGYKNLFTPSQKTAHAKGNKVFQTDEELYDYILDGGGVYIPKENEYGMQSDFYQEWSEDLSHGKKTVLGTRDANTSKRLDEWADELNMEIPDLVYRLESAKPKKDRENKTEEEKEKELQERMMEHYKNKEALEEINNPEYDVAIEGEPTKENPGEKVQEIYEKLIEKEAGATRAELMKDAWRQWYEWSGAERPDVEGEDVLEEEEEVVPFKQDNDFFGKTFYVTTAREVGVDEDEVDRYEELLSKAVSHAHDLHPDKIDSWGKALKLGYKEYGLLEPMSWVSSRAHKISREQGKDYSESFKEAYKEWVFQNEEG